MSSASPLSRAGIRTAVLAGFFVILAIIMVVVGWTEEHVWQSIVLQAAWLMFDVAVFLVLWHVINRRQLLPPRGERFRMCWYLMLGGCGLGLLLYLIALVTRHAMLTPLGQLCLAVGLGSMALYLAATSLRAPGAAHVEAVPELDEMFADADPDVDAPLEDLVSPRRAADGA